MKKEITESDSICICILSRHIHDNDVMEENCHYRDDFLKEAGLRMNNLPTVPATWMEHIVEEDIGDGFGMVGISEDFDSTVCFIEEELESAVQGFAHTVFGG